MYAAHKTHHAYQGTARALRCNRVQPPSTFRSITPAAAPTVQLLPCRLHQLEARHNTDSCRQQTTRCACNATSPPRQQKNIAASPHQPPARVCCSSSATANDIRQTQTATPTARPYSASAGQQQRGGTSTAATAHFPQRAIAAQNAIGRPITAARDLLPQPCR